MRKFRPLSAVPALALALCAAPALAQDWYSIEVIVFEHRADASAAGERFPRNPGLPDVEHAVSLQPPTEPRTLRPFEQLPPQALQMGGALRTLDRSSRYQPLVHVGWIQPGLPRDQSVALRISMASNDRLAVEPLVIELPDDALDDGTRDDDALDGEALADDLAADDLATDDLATDDFADWPGDVGDDGSAVASETPDDLFAITNPWWLAEELRREFAEPPVAEYLQGTITLVLQRFLHVDTDLLLTTDEPLPGDAADLERDWTTRREEILADLVYEVIGVDEARARLEALHAEPRFQAYRLRESRRVRSGELHYIDHPKFGAVVMVRPVPRDEVEARQQAYDEALERALEQRARERGFEPLPD